MSVFDKACPKCLSVSAAYAPRCACGYAFNNASEEDRTLTPEQIAQQEVLFEEYLAARSLQAAEALRVAMRAAELYPQDVRKATEAMRAQQAAATMQAELQAQRARARSAVQAAGLDRAALLRARSATPLLAPVVDGVLGVSFPGATAGNRTALTSLAVSLRRRARRRAGALALKRAVTKTVAGAAKTTTIVAKVATSVVGAAARRAARAVKATRARRRLARAAAQAVPRAAHPAMAPTAVKTPMTAGVPGRAAVPVSPRPVSGRPPAAQPAQNAVRARGQTVPTPLPPRPAATQSASPSPRFRRMQAQKIAAAVVTARGLDAASSTVRRCPLCGVQIPRIATRCQCGWRVGAAERDMPALPPLIGDVAAIQSSSIRLQQCPQCTATLAPGALQCNCGWRVPAGTADLSPVSLTADERQALSLGRGLLSRRPTR